MQSRKSKKQRAKEEVPCLIEMDKEGESLKKTRSKKEIRIINADLLDWLLAIDANIL